MEYLICEKCQSWSDEDKFRLHCHECKDKRIIKHPDAQLCNKCGSFLCPPKPNYNWKYPDGLVDAVVIGSYDSTHLLDMNAYHFSLCELCLRKMFDECVIPPIVYRNNDFNDKIPYVEDKTTYEYSRWEKDGGYNEAYLNRKCNSIKDCPNAAKYTVLSGSEDFSKLSSCEDHSSNYPNSWYKLVPFISNKLKAFI